MTSGDETSTSRTALASHLHRLAIHLLRRVRREDTTSGLSPARLSALSVVVHAGPLSLGELASEEQVRPPTMSRLVDALEELGLVRRRPDPADARAVSIQATGKGRKLLEVARLRRIDRLVESLDDLDDGEIEDLSRALEILDRVFERPPSGA